MATETLDLTELTSETFLPHVGSAFRIAAPGCDAVLELVEAAARNVTMPPRFRRRQPFTLVFRGPAEPIFAQQIFPLAHDRLGRMEIFLVPLGPEAPQPDSPSPILYQAVFN